MKKSIFERYPQLETLRGLVQDKIIKREVGSRADEFEKLIKKAATKIKTVKLYDIFPPEIEKEAIQLENFLGHWGNVSVEEVCKITLIAKFFKPKKVFEFGTYNGMTTLQIALNTPNNTKIYTLDLPPELVNSTKFQLQGLDKYLTAEFRAKFSTHLGSYFKGKKEEDKITQILSDSATFNYLPFYGQVDLIFVDAGHNYHNEKNDSENALKMVSANGIILWHNYNDVIYPDTTRYLVELAEHLPLFHLRGTHLVVYWNKQQNSIK